MLADLVARGGPVMYLLLSCSVAVLAITLERIWFWITERRALSVEDLKAALNSTAISNESPLSQRIAALVSANKCDEAAILLSRESNRSFERANQHLSGLDTVISIAPLLGILGTVLGIMSAFHALDLQHMSSPGEVGHGLAEAMITTATGLAIAVPTLVLYNFFSSMATRRAAKLYELAEQAEELARGISTAPESVTE